MNNNNNTLLKDLEVVTVLKPRVYIQWTSRENGYDKRNCFERIDEGYFTIYINSFNPNHIVIRDDDYFKILEKAYNTGLNMTKKDSEIPSSVLKQNKIENPADLPEYGKYFLVSGIDKLMYDTRRWHVCEMNDLEDGLDFKDKGEFFWLTESGREIKDVTIWCDLPMVT